MAHVGDVNIQPVALLSQPLHVDRVIEILRRLTVDRDNRQIAKILSTPTILRIDPPGDFLDFFQSLCTEAMGQMMLSDHDFHIHAEIFPPAQNLNHTPPRCGTRARELCQLHIDNHSLKLRHRARPGMGGSLSHPFRLSSELAVAAMRRSLFRGELFAARNGNPGKALLKREYEVFRMPSPELADDRLLKPVDDFDNFALHAAGAAGARSHHLDAVAVHCRTHRAGANIDVLIGVFQRRVGNDESISVTVRYQTTSDQTRARLREWAFLSI